MKPISKYFLSLIFFFSLIGCQNNPNRDETSMPPNAKTLIICGPNIQHKNISEIINQDTKHFISKLEICNADIFRKHQLRKPEKKPNDKIKVQEKIILETYIANETEEEIYYTLTSNNQFIKYNVFLKFNKKTQTNEVITISQTTENVILYDENYIFSINNNSDLFISTYDIKNKKEYSLDINGGGSLECNVATKNCIATDMELDQVMPQFRQEQAKRNEINFISLDAGSSKQNGSIIKSEFAHPENIELTLDDMIKTVQTQKLHFHLDSNPFIITENNGQPQPRTKEKPYPITDYNPKPILKSDQTPRGQMILCGDFQFRYPDHQKLLEVYTDGITETVQYCSDLESETIGARTLKDLKKINYQASIKTKTSDKVIYELSDKTAKPKTIEMQWSTEIGNKVKSL